MSFITILLLVTCCYVHGNNSELLSRMFTKLTSEFTEFKSLNISFNKASRISCASRCMGLQDQCYSFIFQKGIGYCELGSKVISSAISRDMSAIIFHWVYDTTDPVCAEKQLNDEDVYERSSQCKPIPDTCRDVVSNHGRVIVILSNELEVMCDTQTDGGGWTIFQRRVNGKVDFHRGWDEYRYGFGNYSEGEFYLGNENILNITSARQHELRVDLSFNKSSYFAMYSSFTLLSEPEGYRLQVEGYSGNAGDSLSYQNNMKFAASDTTVTENCSSSLQGAWWFEDCQHSNLNGVWGARDPYGVIWETLTGYHQSADTTEMKFREI